MNLLFLIPARGGSKGIPHKNIKMLNGKPLIDYSIDIARKFTTDSNICVSSDDDEIIYTAKQYGLNIPFRRPEELATDKAGSNEVILHALKYYEQQGIRYDAVVLLQPTSPFRRPEDVEHCLEKYNMQLDMSVTVKEASTNPYYNCFEEDASGLLKKTLPTFLSVRRQDAPKVYEYNGAVYVINVQSIKRKAMNKFTRITYYLMDDIHSLDLDTPIDWKMAEMYIKEGYVDDVISL